MKQATLAIVAGIGLSSVASGQGIGSSDMRQPARISALGGSGVGLQDVDARLLSPASLTPTASAVAAGYALTAGTDVETMRMGIVGRWRAALAVSLDVQQQQVRELLDEGGASAEEGLVVRDQGAHFGVAVGPASRRWRLGLGAAFLQGRVLSTSSRAITLDIGGTARVTDDLTVGAVVTRLGPARRWTLPDRSALETPLGRTVMAGLAWRPVATRALHARTLIDVSAPLQTSGSWAVRVGGEAVLDSLLALRGGYGRQAIRGDGTPMTGAFSAGLGILVGNLRLDLARESLGADLGERTLIEATLRAR